MDFFSEKVRSGRAWLDISQKQLAEICGVSEPTIHNVERGTRPNARTSQKILEGFQGQNLRFTESGIEWIDRPFETYDDYIDVLNDALSIMKPGDELLFHRADDRRSVPEVVQKMNEMREAGLKFRSTISEGNNFIWGEKDEYRQITQDEFANGEVELIYKDRYMIHERRKMEDREANTYWIIKSQQIADVKRKEFENYWRKGKCL